MRPPMPSTPVTIPTFSPFSPIFNSWESAKKDGISYELRFSIWIRLNSYHSNWVTVHLHLNPNEASEPNISICETIWIRIRKLASFLFLVSVEVVTSSKVQTLITTLPFLSSISSSNKHENDICPLFTLIQSISASNSFPHQSVQIIGSKKAWVMRLNYALVVERPSFKLM